jgi:hypothetical protein
MKIQNMETHNNPSQLQRVLQYLTMMPYLVTGRVAATDTEPERLQVDEESARRMLKEFCEARYIYFDEVTEALLQQYLDKRFARAPKVTQ